MGKSSLPLLCRSPLQPGESLLSLLVRLSQLNRFPLPTMVMQICRERLRQPTNKKIDRLFNTETFRVLTELVRIEADELYAASVHRFASTITPSDYKFEYVVLPSGQEVLLAGKNFLRNNIRSDNDLQFCPLCLAESAYHRLCWMPLASAVCLDHKCLLVHRCPRCQKNIHIEDILNTHCCNCYFDLTKVCTSSVADDEFGLFSQTVIQSWLFGISPKKIVFQAAVGIGSRLTTKPNLVNCLVKYVTLLSFLRWS